MKCVLVFLSVAFCAFQMISAWPLRTSGMVFYQPDYYNAHRAFIMQYASRPIKSNRRQGQAAGVSAFVSGKKTVTGTYLKQEDNSEDEEEATQSDYLPGGSHSIAEAYPQEHDEEESEPEQQDTFVPNDEVPAHDVPEDTPVQVVPNKKKTPVKANDDEEEEQDDDDEDKTVVATRSKSKGAAGASYFPVYFGSTNGGAIAIANSYSTGKGGTASSRATAYGSPSKSKGKRKRTEQ